MYCQGQAFPMYMYSTSEYIYVDLSLEFSSALNSFCGTIDDFLRPLRGSPFMLWIRMYIRIAGDEAYLLKSGRYSKVR